MKRWLPAAGLTGLAALLGVVAFPEAASAHPTKPAAPAKRAVTARPAARTTAAKTTAAQKATAQKTAAQKAAARRAAARRAAARRPSGRPAGAGTGKTTICHRSRSDTNPYVKITVANPALKAHRAHGDIVPAPAGPCPGGSRVLSNVQTKNPTKVQAQGNTAVRVTETKRVATVRAQAQARTQAQARSTARAATLPETGFDPMTGAMAALALLIIGSGLTRAGNRRQVAYANMASTSTTSDSGLVASARRFHIRGAKAPPPVPWFRRSR